MKDTFGARSTLTVGGNDYEIFRLDAVSDGHVARLPYSLKILLENLLRHEDGQSVTGADLSAVVAWLDARRSDHEIAYRPARVLMQDFTGVPAVVDLAAMREAMTALGGNDDSPCARPSATAFQVATAGAGHCGVISMCAGSGIKTR